MLIEIFCIVVYVVNVCLYIISLKKRKEFNKMIYRQQTHKDYRRINTQKYAISDADVAPGNRCWP